MGSVLQVDEAIEHRQHHLAVRRQRSRRPEVHVAPVQVQAPLARSVQLLQRVLDEEPVSGAERHRPVPRWPRAYVPDIVGEPDRAALFIDRGQRHDAVAPPLVRVDVDLDLPGIPPAAPEGSRPVHEGVVAVLPGRSFDECPAAVDGVVGLELRPPGSPLSRAVEHELAEARELAARAGRQLAAQDLPRERLPGGESHASAEDRLLAGVGRVRNRAAGAAAVRGAEHQGLSQVVPAGPHLDADLSFGSGVPAADPRRELPHGVARPRQRREGAVRAAGDGLSMPARPGIAAGRGHVEASLQRLRHRSSSGHLP